MSSGEVTKDKEGKLLLDEIKKTVASNPLYNLVNTGFAITFGSISFCTIYFIQQNKGDQSPWYIILNLLGLFFLSINCWFYFTRYIIFFLSEESPFGQLITIFLTFVFTVCIPAAYFYSQFTYYSLVLIAIIVCFILIKSAHIFFHTRNDKENPFHDESMKWMKANGKFFAICLIGALLLNFTSDTWEMEIGYGIKRKALIYVLTHCTLIIICIMNIAIMTKKVNEFELKLQNYYKNIK